MPLLNFAERAVKHSLRIGADEAEAYVSRCRSILVEIERGDISNESIQEIGGVGIRIIVGGSVGFSHIDKLGEKYIKETVERAYHISKASIKDPYASLPCPKKFPKVYGVYDRRIADLQVEECIEKSRTTLEAALNFDKRVRVDLGRLNASISEEAIVNSNGVSAAGEGTLISVEMMTLARENGEVSSFAFESDYSRKLDVDFENIGVIAAKKAVEGLKAKTVESFDGTILLDFDPSAQLIGGVLAYGINSENVQRNASPLKGRVGSEIAVPELNILDDGLLEGGLGTRSFDDEGIPQQKTIIVKEGVLKNFIYNHYTAKKEGIESTGNASRGIEAPFESPPRVSPSNMKIEPGIKSWEKLKDEIDRGIIVGRFSGSVEFSNGNFSGVAKQGFLVEQGEMKHALIGTMISGNSYQLLKEISGISKEVKDVPYLGFIKTPMIRIENVKIIGKA